MHGVTVAAFAISVSAVLGGMAACGTPAGTAAGSQPAGSAAPGPSPSSTPTPNDQSARQRLLASRAERASAALPSPGSVPSADPDSEPLRVGALFTDGSHYCTASVVDSPRHNVLITAAHCLYPANGHAYNRGVTFVPRYQDGQRPLGTWTPERLIVDRLWTTDSDPELDVGFVVLRSLHGKNIQDILGGNRLGINAGYIHLVRVTGYPSNSEQPVTCVNWTTQLDSTQLRFACAGFFDGTSGSPWVTDFDPLTATGMIVGVIGGFEEGGSTDSVSYSAYLSNTARRLYQEASG